MYKVCPFQYGDHQAIVIPPDIAFEEGVTLEVYKEGEALILRPQAPCWASLQDPTDPSTGKSANTQLENNMP